MTRIILIKKIRETIVIILAPNSKRSIIGAWRARTAVENAVIVNFYCPDINIKEFLPPVRRLLSFKVNDWERTLPRLLKAPPRETEVS